MSVLDDYHNKNDEWQYTYVLACQRALQIAIEAMIGLARYVVELRHDIRVSKTRGDEKI